MASYQLCQTSAKEIVDFKVTQHLIEIQKRNIGDTNSEQ
jgi:hypothetical protein